MEPTKITIEKTGQIKGKKSPWLGLIQRYGKLIIYAEIVLIISLGFFIFVVPKWREVTSDTEGGLSYWQEERDKLQAALVDAQKLVKVYNSLDKSERAKLMKILPSEADMPRLMDQLESLFASEEIFLTSLGFNPLDDDLVSGKIKTLEVEISFSPPQDYYQFKRIMEKLEANIRLLNIKSFRYSPDATDITVMADVYFVAK